jgi:N-methylhydantoinase A
MMIGIDVGGTFTDLVLFSGNEGLDFVKVPSTPADPATGVMDALEHLAERRSTGVEDLLRGVEVFIHGTTVATNTLVQRNGARLGLITTRGFRDVLEMREGAREKRYTLRLPAPEQIIERPQRLEVRERLRADGSVAQPIDLAEVREAVGRLRGMGVEGVVVCLLHAYTNPAHERAVAEVIHETGWPVYVSLSHEILNRQGEYDRLSTAAVNAYVGPRLQSYLDRLAGHLRERGIAVPVFVMQSTGGVLPIEQAGRRAVGAVTSGPAGGAMAGALFARELGVANLVTYDTGGTSTDICLIENGVPVERQRTDLADLRIAVPGIDVNPLGIGGGSIARVDADGILAVGPEGAGAVPGAACFGRGGVRATLTDANLVLGLLDPDNFLGGRMRLSVEAARTAVHDDVAAPLGMSIEDAAYAIHVLASAQIAEGVRLATVRRGKDPRDFSLMCFGGAGGLHADAVARELEIPHAVIPKMASVLSALGFLAADLRQDRERMIDRPIRDFSASEFEHLFGELEADARDQLAASGGTMGGVRVVRSMECRYVRQVHGIRVNVDDTLEPARLEMAFTAAYRDLYSHAHEGEPAIVHACRVSVFGELPKIVFLRNPDNAGADPSPAYTGVRDIYLGRLMPAAIYRLDSIRRGMVISGPAVIESASTTILVQEASTATLDAIGNIVLERSTP